MCFLVPAAGFFAKSHMMFFLLSSFRFYTPLKNDGRGELRFGMTVNDLLPKKKRTRTVSRPRLSGKVAAVAVGRGKREQKRKTVFYKTVVNTCTSFLNEVMASEPLFEERSDAVKVSETLCLG
ncbi:MAG: hypothetical protein ACLR1D_04650 [Dialister sp.]